MRPDNCACVAGGTGRVSARKDCLPPISAVTSRAEGKTFEVTDEASFASAIRTESTTGNVNDPTIIKLKNDITLANGSYVINYYTDSGAFEGGNCSIRLDLCGHTLTIKARKYSTGAIMAGSKDSEDSRFELVNSDKSRTGKVVYEDPSGSAGYRPFLFVTGNGEAMIGGKDSGNIEISGFNAGALQVGTSHSVGKLPRLTLNEGVTLVHNYAAAGGSSFKQGGGAVCVGRGTFIMNGGTIKNNEEKAGKGGGAVYVASGCSFTMNGGTIEGCTTNGKGGAVYGASGSTIILNGGTIDNCTATSQDSNGGGIFLAGNSTLTMNGGTLKNCHSSGFYGGGVYISSEASFTMHDGALIDGCMAERSTGGKKNEGGGVYNTGTFTMDGGTIRNCTAVSRESRGGGVYVATGSSFTMSGGEITGNNAATGGGVGLWGGTFAMSGGTIKNNMATGDGNEISMLYGSADIDFNMTGGRVLHDTEGGGRSQIYVSGDNSSMKVSGGAQIDVGGSNYGIAGNGSVQIDSGYVKAVGKVHAYEYTPTVGNLIAAAGDIGAEKILDKITAEDYQKQAMIVATGTGNVFTVKFRNPSYVTADTPQPIRVIRGMHLTELPSLKDQGSKYFGGWLKEDGKLWTSTDTVTADTTLESSWNSYSVDIRRQDDNTSVSSISITVPFGYLKDDGDQDLRIWNYGSAITASLEKESEVLDIQGIFVYGESGLVDSTSIGAYDSRGLYIGIKKDLSAGTYYSELVLNIQGSEGTYKSRKVIPVTVVVEKATPNSVTAPRAEELAYGKTLQEASLNGGSVRNYKYINGQPVGYDDIPGTFTWAEPDRIPGIGDSQTFDVIFTPDDTNNYNIIRLQVPLNVKKATAADIPELRTFNGIAYGQTLADVELTDGWSWVDPSIKPEAGGSYEAYFAIDNESNYDLTEITDYADGKITRSVAVTVTKAVPVVTQWPTAKALSEGDALSESVLTGGAAEVPGSFVWTEPDTIPELGTEEYEVTFTPAIRRIMSL